MFIHEYPQLVPRTRFRILQDDKRKRDLPLSFNFMNKCLFSYKTKNKRRIQES